MFSQLIANSSDTKSLSDFIRSNKSLIDNFVDSDNSFQRQQTDLLEQFVLLGGRIQMLDSLDFSISQNRAFISILFDFAERANSTSTIIQLYQIIQRHNLDIGSRLEASMLYLYNIPEKQTYIDRFEGICSKLQTAIEEEEDNDNKALATFLNYYSLVVYNTSPHIQFALELQAKAKSLSGKYFFLKSDIVQKCVSLDVNDSDFVYASIQNTIDELLGKHARVPVTSSEGFLIEKDTEYSALLLKAAKSFTAIRQIALDCINAIANPDEVFYSLKRGVAILE